MTTAPTPFALDYLSTLKKRQEASGPLALGGGGAQGGGVPDVAPDYSGGGAGRSGGGYQATPLEFVPQPVATPVDTRTTSSDQGSQGASSGTYSPPVAAPEAAPAAPAPPGRVDPSQVRFAAGGQPAGGGGGGAIDFRAEGLGTADYARQKQLDNALRGGGPARLVKGGTFETGRVVKEGVDGAVSKERIEGLTGQMQEQSLAELRMQEAQGLRQKEIDDQLEPFRQQQEADREHYRQLKEQELGDLHTMRETLARDAAETKIDPEQFWADKSMGSKLAFFAASALTGFLNGRAGIQGNQVLDAAQRRVAANVDAQIRNLQNKKEAATEIGRVYQQAKERWGDEDVARAAAMARGMGQFERQVAGQASVLKDEAGQAANEKLLADLALRKEKIWFDASGKLSTTLDRHMATTQDKVVGGGGVNWREVEAIGTRGAAAHPETAAGKGPQRVVVNGTAYDMPNTGAEEGGAIRKKFALGDVAKEALARIEKRYEENLTDRWAATASAAQENDVGVLTETLSVMKDQGMIKEPDVQRLTAALLSPRSGKDTIQSTKALISGAVKAALIQGGAVPVKGK